MKKEPKESEEFIQLQKILLEHKRLYYVENAPIIKDIDYDYLEKQSAKMAQECGFRGDLWSDALPNEVHHMHFVIGYPKESRYNNN